jgi:hypothetical protein
MIAVSILFIAVQSFAIVKHVRLQSSATSSDYLDAVKILIALLAIVVGVRQLMGDKRDAVPAQTSSSTSPPRLDWWRFALLAMIIGAVIFAMATVSNRQNGGFVAAVSLLLFGSSMIGFLAYRWHCLRLELADGRFSLDEYRNNPQRYFRGPPGPFAYWFWCTMAIIIGIVVVEAMHR